MAPLHYLQYLIMILLVSFSSMVVYADHDAYSYSEFESSYVDVVEDQATDPSVPVFWHVPKSGGSSMKSFVECLGMILVNACARHSEKPASLDILEFADGRRCMNLDISTPHGIMEAGSLGFLEYDHTDQILFTPVLHDTTGKLVDASHPGTAFALLRHPVERAVSLFYYLQHASWEPTYAPELANTTLVQHYMNGTEKVERNWMLRAFLGKLASGEEVSYRDLEVAKDLLRRKVLVGLLDQMEESLQRFGHYFGWRQRDEWPACFASAMTHGENAFEHRKVQPGSLEWDLIVQNNELDMEFYGYAVELFEMYEETTE